MTFPLRPFGRSCSPILGISLTLTVQPFLPSGGADCDSDHQLLIAKLKLKLKKVGKITGLVRYNLNQIPYEYTVEVKDRFKELDLVDRVPEELWMEARNIVQEAAAKSIPKRRSFA